MARITQYSVRLTVGALLLIPHLAHSQVPDRDDEESSLEEIVVTGMSVTAGGAQDINFARGEISGGRIPNPDSILAEGLLSQHDLVIPSESVCKQLFCLVTESIQADLLMLPRAQYLVGLGFQSSIDAENWQRENVNIVAVVDKSGSMSGQPLALVRRSLRKLVETLVENDQLSIVLYGDRSHVHLPPTVVARENREELIAAIDAIESAGSTNMEEGLEVGYRLARQTQPAHEGVTRVILFTDERPNVGRTDASSFIGMARDASVRRIGLTTVGVGVQFDTKLATALSSTRGGNLYFLDSEDAADSLFPEELDYMVSELAHDLAITLRPDVRYRIGGVYGVPGELLGWQDETAVTVTIPTVFLSQRGSGIFVSLIPAEEFNNLPAPTVANQASVMAATLSYLPLGATTPESGAVSVGSPKKTPSQAAVLGHFLINEYLSLRAAVTSHYQQNDQETAYQILRNLNSRFEEIQSRTMSRQLDSEHEIVSVLLEKFAHLSGHSSEVPGSYTSAIWGEWEVASSEGDYDELDVGDVLSFTADNMLTLFYPDDESVDTAIRHYTKEYTQEFLLTRRRLRLPEDGVTADYRIRGNRLTLRVDEDDFWDGGTVVLRRIDDGLSLQLAED